MAARKGSARTESKTKRQIDELNTKIDELNTKIDELNTKIESLEAKIMSLQEENEPLEGKVKDLSESIEKLKADLEEKIKNLEEYKSDTDRLYVSQLAFLFERAVCSYVLPDVFEDNKFATIKRMLGHLNGNASLPFHPDTKEEEDKILRDGRRRWEEVCDNLQLPREWKKKSGDWDFQDRDVPQILRAIGYLKKDRVTVAHPSPIKLSEAKEMVLSDSIKEKFTDSQYELIKDFICSMRENLEKGHLHHDEIDFKLYYVYCIYLSD